MSQCRVFSIFHKRGSKVSSFFAFVEQFRNTIEMAD
jgi:hypothetical protein